MTVSCPKNFLRAETNQSTTTTNSVRVEKIQSVMNKKTTEALDCNFICAWDFEKQNNFRTSVDAEKALFLFQRLVELEKSDAPFKDSILSCVNLLQKRRGRVYLSEHNRTLDIYLGVTNVQCTCSDCLNEPPNLISSPPQGANDYTPQLFSVYDEDTIIDKAFR